MKSRGEPERTSARSATFGSLYTVQTSETQPTSLRVFEKKRKLISSDYFGLLAFTRVITNQAELEVSASILDQKPHVRLNDSALALSAAPAFASHSLASWSASPKEHVLRSPQLSVYQVCEMHNCFCHRTQRGKKKLSAHGFNSL